MKKNRKQQPPNLDRDLVHGKILTGILYTVYMYYIQSMFPNCYKIIGKKK